MSYAYCSKNNHYSTIKMASDLWFNSVEELISELDFYGIAESIQSDNIQFKKRLLSNDFVSQLLLPSS